MYTVRYRHVQNPNYNKKKVFAVYLITILLVRSLLTLGEVIPIY